jgi:hypothetical protein
LNRNDPLKALERLIYSGTKEEIKGLQLSLISTAEAACRAILQAACLFLGAKPGASSENVYARGVAEEKGVELLPPLP